MDKQSRPSAAELWLRLIAAETEEELQELESYNNADINKAIAELRKLSEDEEVQEAVRRREEEIKEEERRTITEDLRKRGYSDEFIQDFFKKAEQE